MDLRSGRSETAGWPLPGVEIRIGDEPHQPLATSEPGRIWVSSPGCSHGYGFPPALTPLAQAGWWPSPDVGYVDGDGCLVVVGRLDDCVRTSAGHVVSPAVIAEVLDGYPGIADAVVVALGPAAQPALAALIESVPPIDLAAVHAHLTRVLPASLRPRVLDQVQALPRLSSGKPDRMACIAMLERSSLRSR